MNPVQPWSVPGCSWPGCGVEQTVELSVAGRRCECHRARFDPTYCVELMRAGWPHTAAAYVRNGLPLGPLPPVRVPDPITLPPVQRPGGFSPSAYAAMWGGVAG